LHQEYHFQRTSTTPQSSLCAIVHPRRVLCKRLRLTSSPGSRTSQVVVLTDWQKYIPTDVLQAYIPLVVQEKYLKPDILQLLRPEPEAVAKPGQPLHKEAQRAVVGWQQYLPTSVIKEYVPAQILAKYVPDGTVLATEKDATGGQSGPGNNNNSSSSSSSGGSSSSTPAPLVSGPVVKQAADVGAASSLGSVSKPQSAPKAEPSAVVTPATSEVFAAPMKEPYEAGTRVQQRTRQAPKVVVVPEASKKASKDTARKFRSADAAVKPAMLVVARILKQQEKGHVAHAAAAAMPAASKRGVLKEAGALERLFGGIAGLAGDAEPPPRYAYTPNGGASQPMYPTQNPGNPAYTPVGHAPSQSQSEGYYVPQQPYAPQPPQQQSQQLQMWQQQQQQQQPYYGSVPSQSGQQPLGMPGQPLAPPYASQPIAAVPLPSQQPPQQGGQAAYQNPQAAYPNLQQPQPMPEQSQLPAGMRDVLEAHNFYRARHQAQPVVWDEQLAASAMDAASKCPNSPSGTRGVGENLAW